MVPSVSKAYLERNPIGFTMLLEKMGTHDLIFRASTTELATSEGIFDDI